MSVVALDPNPVYAINIVGNALVKQMSREENVIDVQSVFTVSTQMVACVSITIVCIYIIIITYIQNQYQDCIG